MPNANASVIVLRLAVVHLRLVLQVQNHLCGVNIG